jgi:hypothetical protein
MKKNAEKESALKALAKRPSKLFEMLQKGGHNIHDLKKVGQCSGGLIRKFCWAGIAEIQEDKTIKLVKGIKKSDLPDVDPEPIKIKRAKKQEAKAAKKDRPAKEGKVKESKAKEGKVSKKKAKEEVEEEEVEEARPAKKVAKGKEAKQKK